MSVCLPSLSICFLPFFIPCHSLSFSCSLPVLLFSFTLPSLIFLSLSLSLSSHLISFSLLSSLSLSLSSLSLSPLISFSLLSSLSLSLSLISFSLSSHIFLSPLISFSLLSSLSLSLSSPLISFSLSLFSFSLLSSLSLSHFSLSLSSHLFLSLTFLFLSPLISFSLSLFSLSKASFKWSGKVLQKLQENVYSKILERLHGSNVDADSVTDAEDGVERLMAELLRQKSQVSRTYPGKVLQVSDGRLHASFNLAPFYLCWISFPRTASFTCCGDSGRCVDKNGTMSALDDYTELGGRQSAIPFFFFYGARVTNVSIAEQGKRQWWRRTFRLGASSASQQHLSYCRRITSLES